MITFAGITLGQPSPQLVSFAETTLPLADVLDFEQPEWQAPGRWEFAQEARYRRLKINTLYWPVGACKWAWGIFLAAEESVKKIRPLAYSGTQAYAAQPFVMSDAAGGKITTNLYLLSARPISQLSAGWSLLAFVDERYFWWEKSSTISITGGTTTWATLFTTLGTALGVTITPDTISSAYLKPTDALAVSYGSLPPLLDAAAASVGHRVVRSLAGAVTTQAPLTALAAQDVNLQRGFVRGSGGSFVFDGRTTNDLGGRVPATFQMLFPKWDSGTPAQAHYVLSKTLTELALTRYGPVKGHSGTKTVNTTITAGFAGGGTPANETELQTLLTQAATDFYHWKLARLNARFNGICNWSPEAFSDHLEWTDQPNGSHTRVQRPSPEPPADPCCLEGPGAGPPEYWGHGSKGSRIHIVTRATPYFLTPGIVFPPSTTDLPSMIWPPGTAPSSPPDYSTWVTTSTGLTINIPVTGLKPPWKVPPGDSTYPGIKFPVGSDTPGTPTTEDIYRKPTGELVFGMPIEPSEISGDPEFTGTPTIDNATIIGVQTYQTTGGGGPGSINFVKQGTGSDPTQFLLLPNAVDATPVSAPVAAGTIAVFDVEGTATLWFAEDASTWVQVYPMTGSGITTLEGQSGAVQTFADDTNVTMVSAANTHTLTWAGQLALARGGTGANLADPGADRILFWDDSASAVTWLTAGTGLTITTTTITSNPVIGSAVTGGTATRVLFIDGSGNLADDSAFTFNATTNALTAGTLALAQGTITDLATAFSITSTWNDAADAFVLIDVTVTNTASLGTSMLYQFTVGTVMASLDRRGNAFFAGVVSCVRLSILDGGADHYLSIDATEDLTAARLLSIVVNDADRTLTIGASTTLSGGTHSGTNTGDEPAADDTTAGVLEIATQAEQETGTDATRAVTPGRQHFHASAAKFWVEATAGNVIETSYNVASTSDAAAGTCIITIATDFSGVDWCCLCSVSTSSTTVILGANYDAKAAGAVTVRTIVEAGSATDPSATSGNASWSCAGFGDHA